MTSRQGGRLVEEEELRPMIGLHHLSVPTLELQLTDDPTASSIVVNDPLVRRMQNAAITGEQPSFGDGNNLPIWCHSVLQRHHRCDQVLGPNFDRAVELPE